MASLQDITGQESGIVIYSDREAIICNWTNVDGYPRVFGPAGLMGLGESIPETEGVYEPDLSGLADGVTVIYNANDDAWPVSGTVYRLDDGVTVIAPDDWA